VTVSSDHESVPQFSADGRWWWDGSAWVAADQASGLPEALGSGPQLPPLSTTETRKILLLGSWGQLRLLWAVVRGKPTTSGWSGEPRAVTPATRRLVLRYSALTLALPFVVVLLSWLWSSLRG
jgi:hypothetical protein